MAIVKWDPFRGLDRFFEDDFGLMPLRTNLPSDLSVDVYEKGDNVIAEMHVAGMDPKKLDISIENNYLRVIGCKEETQEDKDKNYYFKEIQRGSFERTIRLPSVVKEDAAKASYEDGILKITVPKQEPEKKHKKIAVEVKSNK